MAAFDRDFDVSLSRRSLLLGVAASGLLGTCSREQQPSAADASAVEPKALRVGALFTGQLEDGGFVQAGYRGLTLARDKLGAAISVEKDLPAEEQPVIAALRRLADAGPDLVIAHGAQNESAVQLVAADYPQISFVVTQGAVTGPNLSSYEVRQEQSAFLAGALAAWTTKTGVVGHMAGARAPAGLKSRAAYANGCAFADPRVKLLTNFSGDPDDSALSKRLALALADAKSDVIFTMLNAGRSGAIEACREREIRQIGNISDWVARFPRVFVGSAFADVGLAVYNAVLDAAEGALIPDSVTQLGLEIERAVRLVVSSTVADDVQERLAMLADDVREDRVAISTVWQVKEFPGPG